MSDDIKYLIALLLIKGVGPINARVLIGYCGSAKDVFTASKRELLKVPGIGEKTIQSIVSFNGWGDVEDELAFIDQNEINCIPFYHKKFPKKLTQCEDAPLVLFTKGKINPLPEKVISIVGTRKASDYGKQMVKKLIESIAQYNPLIVSGLAYGIDIRAHRHALENGIPTIGVIAHGLNTVYPSAHKSTARQMLENGGLITEFLSKETPDRQNFPKRNRIIAGIADATIVVETPKKGGSMITAYMANGYNRDVFAFPGKANDSNSRGCNHLIKSNIAAMIEHGDDVAYQLGWEAAAKPQKIQRQLFIELSNKEKKIIDCFGENESLELDVITRKSQLALSQVLSELLHLEFKGLIKSLPGKMYKRL